MTKIYQCTQRVFGLVFFFMICINLNAQVHKKYSIKGQIADKISSEPLGFATIALKRISDSTLLTGVASDAEGKFTLEADEKGIYELQISSVGYEGTTKIIDLNGDIEAGTFLLQEKSVSLSEIIITGERKKAENGAEKTTWLINRKMYNASNSGTDILGHIPGIMVDFMKNISLAGSQKIVILVDGRERERNFVSQIDATLIDKVEVISNPGSGYDAGVTGVINIILKKEKKAGISGYINAEVPSSASEIYLFPSYSFSYGTGKLNLYTSYNGEYAYFNIAETTVYNFLNDEGTSNISSENKVRQKNWSHRFHYGFDYFLNEKNVINFYAYNNPWSREFDGISSQSIAKDGTGAVTWSGRKEDTDDNMASFYSGYYRHDFAKPGSKIEFDLSEYYYAGSSISEFNLSSGDQFQNISGRVMPTQNTVVFRTDYTSMLTQKIRFDAGMKVRSQLMRDRQSENFKYCDDVYALHGSAALDILKFRIKAGMRAESSISDFAGSLRKNFSLLPDATINYRINQKHDLSFAWNRTTRRPDLHELNPNTSYSDLFSEKSGNMFLKPELLQNTSLKYSRSSANNFFSFQAYYRKRTNAINSYTIVDDKGTFASGTANLGDIRAWGLEMNGSFKILKVLSVNTYANLFSLNTSVNSVALEYGIVNKQNLSLQSGMSVIAGFSHDITASLRFQYSTRSTGIQLETFSDPLYFVAIEKGFLKKYKVTIHSALPFLRSFIYTGSETEGSGFYNRNEGTIRLSRIPLWFTLKYQFNSGNKVKRIDRTKEEISNMPSRGF